MRSLLIALIALSSFAFVGCGPSEPEGKIDGDEQTTNAGQPGEGGATAGQPAATNNAPTGDGSGIAVHGAGAGGIAPVTGTENLQGSGGGGGGVGQAAKSSAHDAANKAGGSSLDQLGDDGE